MNGVPPDSNWDFFCAEKAGAGFRFVRKPTPACFFVFRRVSGVFYREIWEFSVFYKNYLTNTIYCYRIIYCIIMETYTLVTFEYDTTLFLKRQEHIKKDEKRVVLQTVFVLNLCRGW